MAVKTLAQLRTIVQGRGFAGRASADVDRWINEAGVMVFEHADWPFREAQTAGTSPLVITNASRVRWCILGDSTTTPLPYIRFENELRVSEIGTGSAVAYAVQRTHISSAVVLALDSNGKQLPALIGAGYVKAWAVLSSDSTTHPLPERYEHVLIDAACLAGAKDSREWGEVASLTVVVNDHLESMVDQLMPDSDGPMYVEPVEMY